MTKDEWIKNAIKALERAEDRLYDLQGSYRGDPDNVALMESIKEIIIRGKKLEDDMGN